MKPVAPNPGLPRPGNQINAYSLADYDSQLHVALTTYFSDLAFRVNNLLPKDGSEAMNGPLDFGGFRGINAANPVDPQDVATKDYVDGASPTGFLPLAGGTMTGPIDMDGNGITDLPGPTDPTDVATKAYVDAQAANFVIRMKTASQSHTNTTWTDVTDLSFPVTNGSTWIFEADVWAEQTGANNDTQFGFNGPAFSDFFYNRVRLPGGANPAITSNWPDITTYDAGANFAFQVQSAFVPVRGMVTFTADGTFTARMRRGSGTSGTAIIHIGSILRAYRIA